MLDPLTVAENAAAISDWFHCDKARYQKFYDQFSDDLSGFPGIWKYIAQSAVAFTKAEALSPVKDGRWIDCMEAYSKALYDKTTELNRPLTEPDFYELAAKVIDKINEE